MEHIKPVSPVTTAQDNKSGGDAKEATLNQIRDLIYGDSRRELTEQLEHLLDRQREFEDWTRREARRIADNAREAEKRQDEARKTLIADLSASVDAMGKAIAKLAEK